MIMTNERYDALQKVIRIILPLVTFLTAIGDIWGIGWMSLVTATISAFGVFLGNALEISNKNYKKEQNISENAVLPDKDEEE